MQHGGADEAVLYAVVWSGSGGKQYRAPRAEDVAAAERAKIALQDRSDRLIPDEQTPNDGTGGLGGGYRTRKYGIDVFRDFFTSRQRLSLKVLADLLLDSSPMMRSDLGDELGIATHVCLSLAIDRCVNQMSAFCKWDATREQVSGVFARQAIPMLWDFGEVNPIGGVKSYWEGAVAWVAEVLECTRPPHAGQSLQGSATSLPLPDDAVDMLFTDPPYYDAVPYAELADFFWVWLRRTLPQDIGIDLTIGLTPKAEECVVNMVVPRDGSQPKDAAFFERTMTKALSEARRVVKPSGIGTIVFAHKSTSGWEAQLQAMLEAGWVVTASWPIDTELGNRLRAQNSAALGSSVHLVCRPRETADGTLANQTVGNWREVLRELPLRIREWLPRLAQEGVVGADAIFACLGPALEVFSRYARVERASGERVSLRDYLEHVWAAVSQEALTMIFDAADTSGLEADARVTAMWLWTIASSSADSSDDSADASDVAADDGGDDEKKSNAGFALEYDAARKIAQGLGARLEEMEQVVEVKGDKARLLSVSERVSHLFGKTAAPSKGTKRKQMTLIEEDADGDYSSGATLHASEAGTTVLDRVHQAMLLFGLGRGDALKRFVAEDGVGKQPQFWKLAQSLSALYPVGSNEKRWIDGVLARKKGLGF